MSSWYGTDLDWYFHELKTNLPHPVVYPALRTVDSDDLLSCHGFGVYGDYIWGSGVIRIARGLGFARAVDTLVHEYAHFMDDDFVAEKRVYHGISWGRQYARVYGVVFGKN